MMRKLAILFVLVASTLPALAAKRVTVEQLEQAIAASHGKPDADVAWQISNLELAERLSSTRLAHLKDNLQGEKSRQALVALADSSAFLDPPAGELPANGAPDFAEQRRLMALVVAYVGKTIPQLPNFFATRLTTRFEDTPQLEGPSGFIPYEPLHPVESTRATVLYRGGREVVDTGATKVSYQMPMAQGLNTWGVFGPILGTVLVDAAQNKLTWSHWEQGTSGPDAVFKFEVPKEKSHYEVNFCCVAAQTATVVAELRPFRELVGYQGEMAVDPATGTILRLALEADLKTGDPVVKAGILVEYGPVDIGGQTYFCPVKSVSTALAQTVQLDPKYKFPLALQLQPLKNSLSDVSFEQYHLFRADVRVLTAEEARLAGAAPSLDSADVSKTESAATAPVGENTAEKAGPESSAAALVDNAAASSTPVAASTPVVPPTPALEPPTPEISMAPAAGLPDVPANPPQPTADSGFTLRATSRLVDVDLVAYDKKGRPVTNLKPDDFEIYENGRKQTIEFFSQAGSALTPGAETEKLTPSAEPEQLDFSNRQEQASNAKSGSAAKESNATVLMIDASNLAFGDLTYARSEMLRFLKSVPPDEPVGLYVMKSYGFEVLQEPDTNHAQLVAILTTWMPSAQDLARAQDEEERNRQQFDLVHSVYDLSHVNGNEGTDPETFSSGAGVAVAMAHPPDAKLRSMGSNPERDALFRLEGFGRHLAGIPGHKTLVWVASDNVLADFSNQAASKEDQGNKFIHSIAVQVQETLNEAHVSIYPLDASQLEAGGVAADIGTRNVLPIGKSDRDQAMAALGDDAALQKPGRATAQMKQDIHPIQPEFTELAKATGGRALRRAGDIAGELNSIVEDGRAAYLLSFAPDVAPDDKYHQLTVKVTGRSDITLRYRTGYEYDKEPATLKDRFKQAIWQPADLAQIAMSAHAETDAKGKLLRLNIAGTDMELAQQGDRWAGALDIFLVEQDDEGLHAKVTGQTVGLRLQPATYQKVMHDGLTFDQRVETKLNGGSLRVVVVDEKSGKMGTITVPVEVLDRVKLK